MTVAVSLLIRLLRAHAALLAILRVRARRAGQTLALFIIAVASWADALGVGYTQHGQVVPQLAAGLQRVVKSKAQVTNREQQVIKNSR